MDTPPQELRRRSVLTELPVYTDGVTTPEGGNTLSPNYITPPTSSPDELIIQRRGQRRMPITWSPVDITKISSPPTRDDETPQKSPPKNLRRSVRKLRLILTPEKNPVRNLFDEFDNKKLKLNTTNSP